MEPPKGFRERFDEEEELPLPPHAIRPIAICLFRRDDTILVFEGFDPVKNERFYRPVGGGIEFGERSSEALVREVREELDTEITDLCYLGAIENIFTYDGGPGHEIVMVYDGRFADPERDAARTMAGDEGGSPFTARRVDLSIFRSGGARLYPAGLLELIETPRVIS